MTDRFTRATSMGRFVVAVNASSFGSSEHIPLWVSIEIRGKAEKIRLSVHRRIGIPGEIAKKIIDNAQALGAVDVHITKEGDINATFED